MLLPRRAAPPAALHAASNAPPPRDDADAALTGLHVHAAGSSAVHSLTATFARRTVHTDRLGVLRTGAPPGEALSGAASAALGRWGELEACCSFSGDVHEASALATLPLPAGASAALSGSVCCGERAAALALSRRREEWTHTLAAELLGDGAPCALLRATQRAGRRASHTCVRLDAAGGVHVSRELLLAPPRDDEPRPRSALLESRVLLRHTLRGKTELSSSGTLALRGAKLRCAVSAGTHAPSEASVAVARPLGTRGELSASLQRRGTRASAAQLAACLKRTDAQPRACAATLRWDAADGASATLEAAWRARARLTLDVSAGCAFAELALGALADAA